MPKLRLSKAVVDKLNGPSAETIYWDEALPGFGLRVKPNGTKSYVIQYRTRSSGKSRRKTLGQHGPLLSFNQAKKLATGLLSDVLRGGDPVADAVATRNAPSIADLAEQYYEIHALPKKRKKSAANDRSMLDRLVLPRLGKQKVFEVVRQIRTVC